MNDLSVPSGRSDDAPQAWLRSTSLLDLDDPRLRLRARSLTQLGKNDRERALAVYAFVKRMPFAKPLKLHTRTAREVLDAGCGDSPDKGTLIVALLRLAGIPARLHWYEMKGDILRGLVTRLESGSRPFVEAWIGERWVMTDTYIFDAAYMAAARQRLREYGWSHGFGIHRDGHAIWNGLDGAYVNSLPPASDPMVLADHGCTHDPAQRIHSDAYRSQHHRVVRSMHWNLLAPGMQRAITDLRDGRPPLPPSIERRAS
ncbi:transglutaminase-like domain-containing protein [Ramlibacter algicola]|uniref:Transglutaminase domain-containing protein n=1 Tax=Ramlibacter algicola TaxID=2795217 RepID=A0A934UT07_9BURK|nr:transglutaminase-like domain-containing protein [Ramlibacter algicola]MBK0394042.1 transglutaminase domain-containing protein [Ramlibacter algicola]